MEEVAEFFFAGQKFQNAIANLAARLSVDDLPTAADKQFVQFIRSALELFRTHARDFDAHCQFNINLIGSRFYNDVEEARTSADSIEGIFIYCYRFLSEFAFYRESDFPGDVGYEVRRVLENIQYEASGISSKVKNQLVYAGQFHACCFS